MSTDLRLVLSILLDVVSEGSSQIGARDEHCIGAIKIILEKVRPPEDVIDFVAERLLKIFQQNEGKKYGTLYRAIETVRLGASRITTEKVLQESIRHGDMNICTGPDPDNLFKRLLKRNLNAEEVVWLVDFYTKDGVAYNEWVYNVLREFTRDYITDETVKATTYLRLRSFWEKHRLPASKA
ncbi:MAG: hypothetical protein AAB965_00670 [Patescibacteria group bacterium]